jgi:hypothetical protein
MPGHRTGFRRSPSEGAGTKLQPGHEERGKMHDTGCMMQEMIPTPCTLNPVPCFCNHEAHEEKARRARRETLNRRGNPLWLPLQTDFSVAPQLRNDEIHHYEKVQWERNLLTFFSHEGSAKKIDSLAPAGERVRVRGTIHWWILRSSRRMTCKNLGVISVGAYCHTPCLQ